MLFLSAVLLGTVLACRAISGWQLFPGRGQPVRLAPRALAVAIVALAVAALAISFMEHRQDFRGDNEARMMIGFIMVPLAQFAAGLGLGALLFWVLYQVQISSKSDYIGTLLTALGLTTLFAVLFVTESRYGWFDRLQSVTLAGSTVQLSPTGRSQISRDPTLFAGQIGAGLRQSKADWGLDRLGDLQTMLAFDGENIERSSSELDRALQDNLHVERVFARNVVTSVWRILTKLKAEYPEGFWRQSVTTGLAQAAQTFAVASHRMRSTPREGYVEAWSRYRSAMEEELLAPICRAFDVPSRASRGRKSAETHGRKLRRDCNRHVRKALKGLAQTDELLRANAGSLFDSSLPYGISFAAWLQVMQERSTEAVALMAEWTESAAPDGPEPAKAFLYWRGVTNHLLVLLTDELEEDTEGYAFALAREATRIGNVILGLEPWKTLHASYTLAGPDLSGAQLAQCQSALTEGSVKSFLKTHLDALNNLVFFGASRANRRKDSSDDELWRPTLPLVDKAAIACVLGNELDVHQRRADYLSTSYLAHISRWRDEDGTEAKLGVVCAALNAANKRDEILQAQIMRLATAAREEPAQTPSRRDQILNTERALLDGAGSKANIRSLEELRRKLRAEHRC